MLPRKFRNPGLRQKSCLLRRLSYTAGSRRPDLCDIIFSTKTTMVMMRKTFICCLFFTGLFHTTSLTAQGPGCSIGGPIQVCPGESHLYSGPANMAAYSWTITGQGNISTVVDQEMIGVDVGNVCTGTFTLTLNVTDNVGNSSNCELTVSVADVTPPQITCPVNYTVGCAALIEPQIGELSKITATDDCTSNPMIEYVSQNLVFGSCTNSGSRTLTYKATDNCGKTATCRYTITINDNVPPTLTCPANITVSCTSQVPAVNTGSVNYRDNCTGAVTISHIGTGSNPGICSQRRTFSRGYRGVDGCGNIGECSQIITVNDQVPPTITCPANITVCQTTLPAADINLAVASDNCTGVVTLEHTGDANAGASGSCYLVARTYSATDVCGNVATCSQTIAMSAPLPVELRYFTGKTTGYNNLLSWETATERNAAAHVVERSADGLSRWQEAHRTAAAGDKSTPTRYAWNDEQPPARAYYRLRSIDRDGSFTLSNIVALAREGAEGIQSLHPSPTAGPLVLTYRSETEGDLRIQVLRYDGVVVLEQQTAVNKALHTIELDLSQLPGGVYLIQTVGNDGLLNTWQIVVAR